VVGGGSVEAGVGASYRFGDGGVIYGATFGEFDGGVGEGVNLVVVAAVGE
jgi:hypothetical protein